jgi:hypothetical protein
MKNIKKSRKRSKNICWKGYHRVKGTSPFSKHSCKKSNTKRSYLRNNH